MRKGLLLFPLCFVGGVAHAGPISLAEVGMAMHAANAAQLKSTMRGMGAPASVQKSIDRQLALAEKRVASHVDPSNPDVHVSQSSSEQHGLTTSLVVNHKTFSAPPTIESSATHFSSTDVVDGLQVRDVMFVRPEYIRDTRSAANDEKIDRKLEIANRELPGPNGGIVPKGSWLVRKAASGQSYGLRYLIEAGSSRIVRLSEAQYDQLSKLNKATP